MTTDTNDLAPWVPAGAWVPKVGERVVIRLSGECDHPAVPGSVSAMTGLSLHFPERDGAEGMVAEIRIDPTTPGHCYGVKFKTPRLLWIGGQLVRYIRCWGEFYALAELERLEPAP